MHLFNLILNYVQNKGLPFEEPFAIILNYYCIHRSQCSIALLRL